jgi:hypothetical protein
MSKLKPPTVKFRKHVCTVEFSEYNNGRTAISLYEKDTGEPYCVATVNLPEVMLKEDEVIIKNYSENEGLLDVLIKAGIVSKPIRKEYTGYVTADVCKLLYSAKPLNSPPNTNNMITKSNYFTQVREQNILSRFPESNELHDFVVEATDNGKDWTAYDNEPETREVIDLYITKLNAKLKAGSGSTTPKPVHQASTQKNVEKPKQSSKPKANSKTIKKVQRKVTAPKKPKKKENKVLNLPKGKLVELVDPHLLFVGRYLRMNNRVKSRNTIEKLFAQINQAADAKLLRKASPYAGHIIYIQKQLLKHLGSGEQEFTIDIPAAKFNELIRSVAKEQQMTSVRLLKRYHNMAGKPVDIEKAKRFYNELYNAIEKGKIPERDRLFKRVTQVMKDLQQYVKNEDVQADLVRLPVELGSVLGFMDGCLCTKDREIKQADKPDDVEIDF